VPFVIAIPTLGRWKPANSISTEKHLKDCRKPFILVKTLALFERHAIPPGLVHIFVANEKEKRKYAQIFASTMWAASTIVVGERGILKQRNFIVDYFPEGCFVASFDDDVADIRWKSTLCVSHRLESLPNKALLPLIYDAFARMVKYRAYICGLSTSSNAMSMKVDGLSTRNGEINGFVYFFRNRKCKEILPCVADATEDAERSLRYFQKDRRVLRYRMYCGSTHPFGFGGGLQSLFGAENDPRAKKNSLRKEVELHAAAELHRLFPDLAGEPPKASEVDQGRRLVRTLIIPFLTRGGMPIPSTTIGELQKHNEKEKELTKVRGFRRVSVAKGRSLRGALPVLLGKTARAAQGKRQAVNGHNLCRCFVSCVCRKTLQATQTGTKEACPPVRCFCAGGCRCQTPAGNSNVPPDLNRSDDLIVIDEDSDEESLQRDQLEEDRQLSDALQHRRQANPQASEREVEAWVLEEILAYNGDSFDPMCSAFEQSEAVFKSEQRPRDQELKMVHEALSRSVRDHYKWYKVNPSQAPEGPVLKRRRPDSFGLTAPEREFRRQLVDMGFVLDDMQVRTKYRDAGSNVHVAVAMLFSEQGEGSFEMIRRCVRRADDDEDHWR